MRITFAETAASAAEVIVFVTLLVKSDHPFNCPARPAFGYLRLSAAAMRHNGLGRDSPSALRRVVQNVASVMENLKVYQGVTVRGLPIRLELRWPFHRSEGGSDWYVLHGRLWLADGGELHADIALNLSESINEVLPSRDGDLAFRVAVNTARKALDDKQLQMFKSGKRQPVPVSSRCYSLRRQQFTFWRVQPEELDEFVARKIFWAGGLQRKPVMIADPCDAQYLGAGDPNMVDKLVAAATDLAARGTVELAGDHARATDGLLAQSQTFHSTKDHALEELHAKHAYERS